MKNDREFLLNIYKRFDGFDVQTFIFGGWAEELLGIIKPREHKDIDLLYLADDFRFVDEFIHKNNLQEIIEKRFAHKRAFKIEGIMVEVFLVSKVRGKYVTSFFNKYSFEWPGDTFSNLNNSIRIASPAALTKYRNEHEEIMKNSDF